MVVEKGAGQKKSPIGGSKGEDMPKARSKN
jgi:hypothetical protein